MAHDAEGFALEVGFTVIGPDGRAYKITDVPYSTANIVTGREYARKRGVWGLSQTHRPLHAETMIPITVQQLQPLATRKDVERLYSHIYNSGPAAVRTRQQIDERRAQMRELRERHAAS